MSYRELNDWARYWSDVEPYPEDRQDLRNAMLCKMIADVPFLVWGKKPASELKDFMLPFDRAAEKRAPKPQGRGATIGSDVLTGLFVLAGRKKGK